ncbi:hypothetical protein P7C73_g3297, partial [Tremellales sp. Uapishka_1]
MPPRAKARAGDLVPDDYEDWTDSERLLLEAEKKPTKQFKQVIYFTKLPNYEIVPSALSCTSCRDRLWPCSLHNPPVPARLGTLPNPGKSCAPCQYIKQGRCSFMKMEDVRQQIKEHDAVVALSSMIGESSSSETIRTDTARSGASANVATPKRPLSISVESDTLTAPRVVLDGDCEHVGGTLSVDRDPSPPPLDTVAEAPGDSGDADRDDDEESRIRGDESGTLLPSLDNLADEGRTRPRVPNGTPSLDLDLVRKEEKVASARDRQSPESELNIETPLSTTSCPDRREPSPLRTPAIASFASMVTRRPGVIDETVAPPGALAHTATSVTGSTPLLSLGGSTPDNLAIADGRSKRDKTPARRKRGREGDLRGGGGSSHAGDLEGSVEGEKIPVSSSTIERPVKKPRHAKDTKKAKTSSVDPTLGGKQRLKDNIDAPSYIDSGPLIRQHPKMTFHESNMGVRINGQPFRPLLPSVAERIAAGTLRRVISLSEYGIGGLLSRVLTARMKEKRNDFGFTVEDEVEASKLGKSDVLLPPYMYQCVHTVL